MALYRDPNTGQMIALPDVGGNNFGSGSLGSTLGNLGGSVSAANAPGMGYPAMGAGASNLPPPTAQTQPGAQQPSQSIQLSTGGSPIRIAQGGQPFGNIGAGVGYPAMGAPPPPPSIAGMGYPALTSPFGRGSPAAFPAPQGGAPAVATARPQATIPRTATALAPAPAARPVATPGRLPPGLIQYNVPGSGYRSNQGPIYTAANLGNVMRGLFGR